ncbi:MAG: glycoside hydrolase family 2 TIM barrel-domain containing protein [Candidatus Latescibacterota bacterium]|jgi:beta-glucuronidase
MRTCVDLNGTWDFVADLDPKYHAVHGGFHRPSADRRHWLPVPVPGVWQTYGERYSIFEGVCWFAREVDAPEGAGGASARLVFGGVNYLCRVYLNGTEVGGHEGGYTGFTVDVTGSLVPGRNHLAVMVDNRATTIRWPPCLGYFNYGGIHREVHLEILHPPWLDEVAAEAVTAGPASRLVIRASVIGAEPGLQAHLDLGDRRHELDLGVDGKVQAEVPGDDAAPWTPASPILYPVRLRLVRADGEVADERCWSCGFRTVTVARGQVHLNGEPLRLDGVCYVYDAPSHGLVMTRQQVEADLGLMKQSGCNAVRCHYPMGPVFYEACDRLGLLVWIEPPVYCYHPADDATDTAFADPEWQGLAQRMAEEMVAGARLHPSVAIYGLGNECNTRNAEAEPFFRALAATLRRTDPTRLLAYAALYGNVGPLARIVDVLGVNSYWGWYDVIWGADRPPEPVGDGVVQRRPIDLTPMRRMLDEVPALGVEAALLLTEFGADSVPGFRAASRDLWSEEYHADLLRAVFTLAREYPRLAGTFPFCFADYRDPSKVHNGYWNELNLKGMVDYHRHPKLALTALREAYVDGPAAARGER